MSSTAAVLPGKLRLTGFRHVLALALLAMAVAVALFPPEGMSTEQARAAGLVIGTIGFWATGVLAESLTALIFFTIAMLAKVAPAEIVFSGMVSSAFWLILSGLVVGTSIRSTGLGARIAARLGGLLGTSYGGAMVGVVVLGLVLAFLMPSAMGRIMLVLPILTALAEHLGHKPGSTGYRGLVLGGVFGTFLPSSTILPANVPNNVLAGVVEATLGEQLSFSDYLLVHFPVLGLLKTVLLIAVLLTLFKGVPHGKPSLDTAGRRDPMSPAERRLVVVLAIALALWTTDGLHHISPAWIGMAAAVICLLPRSRLLPPKAMQSINLEPVFYVGAIISLGALVMHAGLGQRLAAWALHAVALTPGDTAANFVNLSGLATLVALLTTLPGVPAVMTPLTNEFATASGFSPATVIITQVIGFSTVLLPYQAPPLVMAMQAADLQRRDVVRLCLVTAGLTILLLWPLNYLWLSFLGRL